MLTITPNDNRETTSYPLSVPNSVYPDGLISDICIAIPYNGTDPEVYIDSVVCTQSYVSIMLSSKINGVITPLGFGTSDRSTHGIVYIFSETSGDCLGWVVLGSVADSYNTYSQRVRVCSSCVHLIPAGFEYEINGSLYEVPETLDIIVAGDIAVSAEESTIKLYNGYDVTSQEYDLDNLEEIGPITTINGIIPDDGTIYITLPAGSTVKEYGLDGATVITIECINKQFSCPDSDILLSKINTEDSGLITEETPLRSYVKQYTGQEV